MLNQFIHYWTHLFDTEGFSPRWACGFWTSFHGWFYIVSDMAIWAAYYTIPLLLLLFLIKRKDFPFPWILGLFAAFIWACGSTHLLDALMFWWPAYRVTALAYFITAVVSWVTVIALVPIIPRAFALRSPKALEKEIAERQKAEEQLREINEKLQNELLERKRLEAEFIQADKLISLGYLAAGIAHEINNPTSFIMSNLNALSRYAFVFKSVISDYQQFSKEVETVLSEGDMQHLVSIRESEKRNHLPFLMDDINNLLSESKEGTERITEIVQDLKSFARMDESIIKCCDVNECLTSTLKIAWTELKYKGEVKVDLGKLPEINCNPAQLNQVFLNLFINAAQAIPEKGEIRIESQASDTHVIIRISDTGTGIAPEMLGKIFDPFFTTKPVGQGTGLGLSISYGIIQKHNGSIEVETEVGKGTTFIIKLPRE